MSTNDEIVPDRRPSPKTTETDRMTALKELSLAVQTLREVVKSCHQDWEMAKADTWILQVRETWSANLTSVHSLLTAVEGKLMALNDVMPLDIGS